MSIHNSPDDYTETCFVINVALQVVGKNLERIGDTGFSNSIMPTHSRQQGSCNSLHPWKRPLEVTNQHTVWVLPSLTMDTVWDAADITLYHNGADEDTVHAWRASKEEGGGRAKGFKIISFQNWELLLLTIHIFLFENRDLENLIKARRGEIEPTHDFTFSLIGRCYSKLKEDNHCSAIGRFSGLHKLQILDFIFNDPTILGNLEVKRWCFTFHQMTLTSSTRVTMLGRCYSTSKWVFQKKTKRWWCSFQPARRDRGGSSCSRESEEGEGLGEECGGNASQV